MSNIAKYPIVGMIRKGCAANKHNFVIANDDSLTCDGCGAKCSGENLAALGFVHRSNIEPPKFVAPIDDGLAFLREPQPDRYYAQLFRKTPAYDIKMMIPCADSDTCTPRQIRIEEPIRVCEKCCCENTHAYNCADFGKPIAAKMAEAPCRTCNKPNDLGVKVCWCCGNAP